MTMLRVSGVSAASPEMNDDEYQALRADIKKRGQQVPILVSGDEVIDGRKRLRACEELGVLPITAPLCPGDDPEEAARSLNLLRTHYTPSQRAMYAARLATRPRGPNLRASSLNLGMTTEQAARVTGTAASSVEEAKALRRVAPPEVVRAVEDGKLTVHAAKQIVQNVTPQDQATAVARAIVEKRGTGHRSVLPQPEKRRHLRPGAEQFNEAIRTAIIACEIIQKCADGLREHPDWPEWERDLRKIRTALGRVITNRGGEAE